jgi:hypothetical protein
MTPNHEERNMNEQIYFDKYHRPGPYPTYVTVGDMIDVLKQMPQDAKVVLTTTSEQETVEIQVPTRICFGRVDGFYIDEDVVDIQG